MAKNSSIAIPITAQDRFSKTLDHLEGKINKLSAPVRRVQSTISRLSGFGPLQLKRGIMGVSSSALGAAKALGGIIPVLGTLTGAASLAGVYRLSSAWARAGQQIGITARSMGVAPKRLQLMQNAAKLAGGSAEGMTAALQGLAQTKFNIKAGLDPSALAQFQAFGISLEEVSKSSPDKLFERISARLRGLKDPVAQATAAQKLLGSGAQGVLPILQQSAKQYADNIALANRYGVMNQAGIDAASRLAHAQSRLELAVHGFGNSLAQNLEPVLTPIITKMADWVAANRQWISSRITDYVKKLVDWFHDGGWNKIVSWAENFAKKANDVAQTLGGWKNIALGAAAGIGLVFAAPVLVGLGSLLLILLKIKKELQGISTESVNAGRKGLLGGRGKSNSLLSGAAIGFVAEALWPLVKDTQVGKKILNEKQNGLKKEFLEDHYYKRTGSLTSWNFNADKERSLIQQEQDHSTQTNNTPNSTTSLTNRAYDAHEEYDGRIYKALQRKVNATSPQALALESSLKKHGFSSPAIAGVMANFSQESGFNPAANNGSHAGIAQWDKGRQAQFQKIYGHAMTAGSLDEQVDFFTKDLAKYPKIQKQIMGAQSAGEAGFAMGRRYEIPGTTDASLRPDVNARAHAAEDWASALASRPQGESQPHQLDVTIHHKNAPANSTVHVSHASPGVHVAGVKTHRAMSPDAVSL